MAQYMASAILGDEIAKMRPDAHVRRSRLPVPPALDRESFKQDEALSIEEFPPDGLQEARESRESEALLTAPP